jgi:phosphoglucomutase
LEIGFPVWARGNIPADSVGRVDLVGVGRPVTCGGVRVEPDDIVVADRDGVVVIPVRQVDLAEVVQKAEEVVAAARRARQEKRTRVCLGGSSVSSSSGRTDFGSCQGREVEEVPVGFKWFVPGLTAGRLGLAGEESAGAVFLCRDGTPWTTDKDGLVMGLLAAEVLALSGQDPSRRFEDLVAVHGRPWYSRVDAQASATQRQRLSRLSPTDLKATMLAGDPIQETLTRAPGNGAPIGGLKVTTDNGWFAARPSGTEDVYKIYAESFVGPDHLARLLEEARELVNSVLQGT